MTENKETTEEATGQSSIEEDANQASINDMPEAADVDMASAALDAWHVAEYSVHEEPDKDSEDLITNPLEINKLLDESRTTIWAVKGAHKIRFVVRRLTSTEMAVFLETLFGISAYLDGDERTKEERMEHIKNELQEMGPVSLYDKILLATEAAIEEPLGITAEMLPNWPEELVNKLTNAATGGAFGDTAQIRFLKELDKSGKLLGSISVGQDRDEIRDAADGDPEEV